MITRIEGMGLRGPSPSALAQESRASDLRLPGQLHHSELRTTLAVRFR
jgi:hypothetical protein